MPCTRCSCSGFVHVDHQDAVHAVACAAFDQQRNGHHDVGAGGRFCARFHVGPDERMENGLQVASRAGIVEYEVPQSAPVECTLAVKDYLSQTARPPAQVRATRLNHGRGLPRRRR